MRSVLLVLSLVAVALAGCSDDTPPPEEDDFEFGEDLEATQTTGIIRGIVVSPSIVPIENVRVQILSADKDTRTDHNGAFGFAGLDEGTYFVQASKLGYEEVQTSVAVKAGEDKPPIVKLQLKPDPTSRPFSETYVFEGFLQCGTGHQDVGSTNPCALADSDNVRNHAVSRPVTFAQSELWWEGTNVLGDDLYMGYYDPSTDFNDFAGAQGSSPVILAVNGSDIQAALGPEYSQITIRVFPGSSQPLTVTYEQRFTVFTTYFYGFEPSEGWTFISHGEPAMP